MNPTDPHNIQRLTHQAQLGDADAHARLLRWHIRQANGLTALPPSLQKNLSQPTLHNWRALLSKLEALKTDRHFDALIATLSSLLDHWPARLRSPLSSHWMVPLLLGETPCWWPLVRAVAVSDEADLREPFLHLQAAGHLASISHLDVIHSSGSLRVSLYKSELDHRIPPTFLRRLISLHLHNRRGHRQIDINKLISARLNTPHLKDLKHIGVWSLRSQQESSPHTPIDLASLLELWPSLEGLDLDGVPLDTSNPELWPSRPIRALRLHDMQLDDKACAALSQSPLLDTLETLDVSKNNIGDAGLRALLTGPALTRVECDHNRIDGALLDLPLETPWPPQLHRLNLNTNPIEALVKTTAYTRTDPQLLKVLHFDPRPGPARVGNDLYIGRHEARIYAQKRLTAASCKRGKELAARHRDRTEDEDLMCFLSPRVSDAWRAFSSAGHHRNSRFNIPSQNTFALYSDLVPRLLAGLLVHRVLIRPQRVAKLQPDARAMVLFMAIGVDFTGAYRVHGMRLADRDEHFTCKVLLRGLVRRGLRGVGEALTSPGAAQKVTQSLLAPALNEPLSPQKMEALFCPHTHPELVRLVRGGDLDFNALNLASLRRQALQTVKGQAAFKVHKIERIRTIAFSHPCSRCTRKTRVTNPQEALCQSCRRLVPRKHKTKKSGAYRQRHRR